MSSSIAEQLSTLYRQRADVEIRLKHQRRDADARRLAIAQEKAPGGWPGKNEEQREMQRDIAFAGDEALKAILTEQHALDDELIRIDAQLDELDARRREWEWVIRGELKDVLRERGVQPNHKRADLAEAAFDDVAQTIVDVVLTAEAVREAERVEEQLPF